MRRHFSGYCAFGIALWMSLQSFVSIGVNLGLLPTKGLTLPLISSGGSSVLMTCAALGLNEQAVKDYIKQSKPTYPQFEAWVKENAKSLNKETVEKHNAAVRGYIHDDETRQNILGANGLADDAAAAKDAVNLNNLDDWYEFHQAVLR